MSNPLTDARTQVAAALAGLGVHVYPEPPESATLPCIIVAPNPEVWAQQLTFDRDRPVVALDLQLLTPISTGRTALDRVEELLWQVLTVGLTPRPDTDIRAPAQTRVGVADAYSVTVPILALAHPPSEGTT